MKGNGYLFKWKRYRRLISCYLKMLSTSFFDWQVIAKGLILGRHSYLKSGWNVMDGSLVIVSLIDIIISLTASHSPKIFGILRVFRLLRTLRPLRLLFKLSGCLNNSCIMFVKYVWSIDWSVIARSALQLLHFGQHCSLTLDISLTTCIQFFIYFIYFIYHAVRLMPFIIT